MGEKNHISIFEYILIIVFVSFPMCLLFSMIIFLIQGAAPNPSIAEMIGIAIWYFIIYAPISVIVSLIAFVLDGLIVRRLLFNAFACREIASLALFLTLGLVVGLVISQSAIFVAVMALVGCISYAIVGWYTKRLYMTQAS